VSSWAEVTGLAGPPDDEHTDVEAPVAAAAPRVAVPATPAALRHATAGAKIHYPGDGPEPEPPVRRLRYMDDNHADLVRTRDNKWRWVSRDQRTETAPDRGGWGWRFVQLERPGTWVVIEVDDPPSELKGHPRTEEPGPEVLRVQPYDGDDQPLVPFGDCCEVVRVREGWWWVARGDHGPGARQRGWRWGGSQLNGMAYWVDATTPQDRDNHASGAALRDGLVFDGAGIEPPRFIVRLEPANGGDWMLTRRPDGGWWFIRQATDVPDGADVGWPWAHSNAHHDRQWRPLYPSLNPDPGADEALVKDLALCLPVDDEWHRIGTHSETGEPVCATRHGHEEDDWDTYVGNPHE